jgi:hypothetical protein
MRSRSLFPFRAVFFFAVVAFFAILLLLENIHPRAGMADQSIS